MWPGCAGAAALKLSCRQTDTFCAAPLPHPPCYPSLYAVLMRLLGKSYTLEDAAFYAAGLLAALAAGASPATAGVRAQRAPVCTGGGSSQGHQLVSLLPASAMFSITHSLTCQPACPPAPLLVSPHRPSCLSWR